jgi:hypothetical protein
MKPGKPNKANTSKSEEMDSKEREIISIIRDVSYTKEEVDDLFRTVYERLF